MLILHPMSRGKMSIRRYIRTMMGRDVVLSKKDNLVLKVDENPMLAEK